MRFLPIAACLIALTVSPAAAQQPADDPAVALPPPESFDATAVMIDRVLGAVLALPVGDVVNAVDPEAGAAPDTTVADLGAQDDPYFEDRLRGSIYDVAGELRAATGRAAALAPVLKRSIARLETDIAVALRSYEDAGR